MEDFSKLLKEARKRAQLTQQELADKVGIDDSYISKIERTGDLPSRDKVLAIIDALGITEFSERAHLLLSAGYASFEDITKSDVMKKTEQLSQRSSWGSPFSLEQQIEELYEPSFGEVVEKILTEARLPNKERGLAQRLILEQVQAICKVIKEDLEKSIVNAQE